MFAADAPQGTSDTRVYNADANTPPAQSTTTYKPQNFTPSYTGTNYSQPATAPASTAGTQQYQQRINQQLDSLSNPVDANSPVVRSQTDAYGVAADRGLAANRSALAQEAYGSGNLGTGSYSNAQQHARENAALGKATNTGQVVATAEAQRQGQLSNLLNLGQTGALSQQSITNQANQFGDTLGLNQAQLRSQEGQFGAGLGLSGAQLAAQEGQFGANFGQNQFQFGVTSAQQQQAINQALDIAKMNDATSRHGIDTNNATSRYGIDTNYNLGQDTLTNNGLINLDQ